MSCLKRALSLLLCSIVISAAAKDLVDNKDQSPLGDQVKLLSKQMNALLNKRRDDFRILESNLKRSVQKSAEMIDLRNELDMLREEVRNQPNNNYVTSPIHSTNNEHLTIKWLTETITELRSEINELQKTNNASVQLQEKEQLKTELKLLNTDMENLSADFSGAKIKILELEELLKETQEDVKATQVKTSQLEWQTTLKEPKYELYDKNIQIGDIKSRHNRFLKKQIRDLQISNRRLLENQRDLEDKFRNLTKEHEYESTNTYQNDMHSKMQRLEREQEKIVESNFNLTRQVVDLDKLHISMLELLENVENIENKIDKSLPELKKEISKLEFNNAQIVSEQNLLKEDGDNIKNSMKAIVVSVSNLMDYRDVEKSEMMKVKDALKIIQAGQNIHKDLLRSRINKIEDDSKSQSSSNETLGSDLHAANAIPQLVERLESVEREYQDIVNKLPQDCWDVTGPAGLYLISPGPGQPIMTYCNSKWTTIQRRFDGSVNFNRNWEEYSKGFGNPSAEFWVGNEALHRLTSTNCSTLKIQIEDIYDNVWSAEYTDFKIGNRADGFKLEVSGYSGNASDALDYQNRMQFSAIDDDRDISNTHCAGNYEGGWWFSHCQHANLNGRYNLGLTWFDSGRNEWIAVKNSHMMISRRDNCH